FFRNKSTPLFVPEFTSSLSVSVAGCSSGEALESAGCSLLLRLGSASLQHSQTELNCSGVSCTLSLSNPPWDSWLRVVVESSQVNRTVTFRIGSNYTGLTADDDITKLLGKSSVSNATATGNGSAPAPPPPLASPCVWSVPVLYEELDVLSLRYTPVNSSNVSVTETHPTLLTYPLPPQATGGTLNLQLTLNSVSNSEKVLMLKLIPCVFCSSDCGNASVVSVVPEVSVSACVDDCGPYGECRLLRSYTYLYSACVCWKGWGCTDGSTAQSYARQLTATMLLTLSNLFFLPAIVVATRRSYITEAFVYLFTMFFSTFYHACDQPGAAVLCIMDYDALQYCDFLGSICSIWVTILCMARLGDTAKYTLFLLGALLIAMSMQLDRKGLWNLLGPILCAILLMVTSWVYRGVRRRHCYPPSWRRWVFFLLPGALCALIGVCLYVFAETESNYYYTHSLWHILVAGCVVFLLPPKEKDRKALGWSQGFSWSWSKDELYTVT
uniref:Uncharacterized protein n=1 Tax=Poecilia mexicana TaxID=48701 RepID=A0A3B3XC08_9TELE